MSSWRRQCTWGNSSYADPYSTWGRTDGPDRKPPVLKDLPAPGPPTMAGDITVNTSATTITSAY